MKEKPLLFSGPMVRAILDGRKTQTRRVFKNENGEAKISTDVSRVDVSVNGVASLMFPLADGTLHPKSFTYKCPYGYPGTKLWVRETFEYCVRGADYTPGFEDYVAYRADNGAKMITPGLISTEDINGKWRPSIHMPRWASRISLEVTGVRMERLQDISTEDIRAEGVDDGMTNPRMGKRHDASMRMAWQALWESINGPDSWAASPWVWIVEFKRVSE